MSNVFDYTVQFSWSYIYMKELSDALAKVIHIFPFLLFFFLVSLVILKDCITIGFLLRLILTLISKRRGRIPTGENLDCRINCGMKDELLITLYFFIIAVITLFLIPLHLLAVIELHRIVFNNTLEA